MSANFNRTGIGAEQDRQAVLRLAEEMRLARGVAGGGQPFHHRTSYLLLAKMASLSPFHGTSRISFLQRKQIEVAG
ncbi:MAG: hypothetical protein M3Y37_08740 [Chloroflexota bacterium]|nr:hypothetical protein [Chloroflexota bacterium]